MNRLKNGLIILILISFLSLVAVMPVTCLLKTVTGISCPACGMTRAFEAILHFNFLEACYQNLLSIPLLLFFIFLIFMLLKDFMQNRFSYIPHLLLFFEKYSFIFICLLLISFIFNNLK
ncbi:MAG: DUF2752 domain-containing protein [Clostridia bacterium]|nr:DUF2752 domain-containing protein [Clostridia bacterium]